MREAGAIPVLEGVVASILILSAVLLTSSLPQRDAGTAADSRLDLAGPAARHLVQTQVAGDDVVSWTPGEQGWLDRILNDDAATSAAVDATIRGLLPPNTHYTLSLVQGDGVLPILPRGARTAPVQDADVGIGFVFPDWRGLDALVASPTTIRVGDALDSSSWTCLLGPSHVSAVSLGVAASARDAHGRPLVDTWRMSSSAYAPSHMPWGRYVSFTTGTTNTDGTCSIVTGGQEWLLLPRSGASDLHVYGLQLVVRHG